MIGLANIVASRVQLSWCANSIFKIGGSPGRDWAGAGRHEDARGKLLRRACQRNGIIGGREWCGDAEEDDSRCSSWIQAEPARPNEPRRGCLDTGA